jgi:hypothetical protein
VSRDGTKRVHVRCVTTLTPPVDVMVARPVDCVPNENAFVGAVTGTLTRPDRLVLGLYRDRALHVVGGTAPLSDVQQRTLLRCWSRPAMSTRGRT